MEEGYCITADGQKHKIFHGDNYKDYEIFYFMTIKKNFGSGGTDITFHSNVTEIVIPEGYSTIQCYNNKIKKLSACDDVRSITCFNNQLEELVIPANLTYLSAEGNPLKKITFSKTPRNEFNNVLKLQMHLDMNTPIDPYEYSDINFRFY